MRHWHFKQESIKSNIRKLSSGNVRFWGGDDEEESAPSLPAAPSYESYIPQRSKDIESQLYDYYKQRLTPEYQAITPEQQTMIFNRIKDQLSPEFEKQMKSQEQSVFNQGITGTPGASILGQLRQDYMKDLMGKGTDIAIENIGLTESGRRYGTGVLENLRSSLLNQANTEYGTAVNDRNLQYQNQYNDYLYNKQQNAAQDTALWSGLGGLVGNVGAGLAYDYLSPTRNAFRNSGGLQSMLGLNSSGKSGGAYNTFKQATDWGLKALPYAMAFI